MIDYHLSGTQWGQIISDVALPIHIFNERVFSFSLSFCENTNEGVSLINRALFFWFMKFETVKGIQDKNSVA